MTTYTKVIETQLYTRVMSQEDMTAECFIIQFEGQDACLECEFVDTPDCGGELIRMTGMNAKGVPVPLPEVE